MKIIKLKEVNSTNEYCKQLQGVDNVIVTAERQTAGRGTKGRSFVSDDGGLYITIMRTYNNFDAGSTFHIMINCCTAVCKTIEKLGVKPTIRWANDVLVQGKKICGTLIENTLSSGNMCRSIVGIGLNVNNTLPPELQQIATTLCEQTGKKIPLSKVRKLLIKNLKKEYTVSDYKGYINWFGSQVTLKMGEEEIQTTAVDVDEDGRLICEIDGEVRKISSAEVSLRLQ
jgi:BirA family biotin operon repressor/biotin-[acetyl-CoA-carboxylase] ligase